MHYHILHAIELGVSQTKLILNPSLRFHMPATIIYYLIFALAVALLMSCSNVESKLVGRWEWEDGSIAEFMKDGTAAFSEGAMNAAGTWKINGDRLTVTAAGRSVMYRIVEITDESITTERIPDGRIETGVRLN